MKYDICLYHRNCADGFTAAWIANHAGVLEFAAFDYGDNIEVGKIDGKHVLIVDFSFPADTLRTMADYATSITVLDHHKTAEAELAEFDWHENWDGSSDNIRAKFNMKRSGAMMTWEHFHPKRKAPSLVHYVQDRDLWINALPDSEYINAYVSSIPFEFIPWDGLNEMIQLNFKLAASMGDAIRKANMKNIRQLLDASKRQAHIGRHPVMIANVPPMMASEAGHILAEEALHSRKGWPAFGATYFDTKDGMRKVSLRSIGDFDVSVIAKRYGKKFGTTGGGHKNAAGFLAPAGWEGDK